LRLAQRIMLAMTRPIRSSKVLLVADRRPVSTAPGVPAMRRYRLARVRPEGPPAAGGARYEYLKRVYD
jgi:hypothetical protein